MTLLLILILLACLPDIRNAEKRAEAEQKRAEAEQKRAELERRTAETARKRAEAEQKRAEALERRQAQARSVIEFYEPRRRELAARMEADTLRLRYIWQQLEIEQNPAIISRLTAEAEKLTDRGPRDREKLFQIDRKLEAAYWTLEE